VAFRDIPVATERCPGCEREIPKGAELCPKCGNPVDIERLAELELRLKPNLRKARTFLGMVAALEAFWILPLIVNHASAKAIGERGFVAGLFSACFLTAFKKPLGASIAALALLIFSDAALIGMGRFTSILQGLVLKTILVVLLVAAIRSGYRARDLRGQWSNRDRAVGIGVLTGAAVLGLLLGLLLGLARRGV